MTHLDRINRNPQLMGGTPCIRDLRMTVGMLVGQLGAGRTIDELLADYPYLEREDVLQALRYAAWRTKEPEIAFAWNDEGPPRHESFAAMPFPP